jgi:nicotinate-nucleotide adenylyltransferase
MRIGVFGGTFDPVHLAHLVFAEQAREQAALERPLTPFAHRVEMLQLAIAGYPAFQVSEIERDREGPSYTADTLAELRGSHSGDEFFLLVGSDCLPDLPFWYDPPRIAAQATLLVAGRPDGTEAAPVPPPFLAIRIAMPLLELASRDLRRRVAEGHSIRYMVPRAVECYIQTHRLYRGASPVPPSKAE